MFAEVSLQGQIVQRVWRYGDSLRFYLSTRHALPGAAPDPAQTHLIDVPIGVTRALAVGRLTVGMNLHVQARLIHRESVETLAQFLKRAAGPKLDTHSLAAQQVRNHRTQTDLIAQSIIIRRPGRGAERPYAEANLLGRISDRIWRHDDQLHFRLLVKQDQGDVITAGQEGACFGCAVAVGELQGTAIHHKVRHHQLGDLVHGRVVVNDQYLPGRQRAVRRCVRLVVTEYQFV